MISFYMLFVCNNELYFCESVSGWRVTTKNYATDADPLVICEDFDGEDCYDYEYDACVFWNRVGFCKTNSSSNNE